MRPSSRRIFTYHLGANPSYEGTAYRQEIPQTFVAQEDLRLVAAQIFVRMGAMSQNDGESKCEVELSQNGIVDQPSTILKAGAYAHWNTVPAFGIVQNDNAIISFGDDWITLREGDVVNLHVGGHGKSAGVSVWLVSARLYFTR